MAREKQRPPRARKKKRGAGGAPATPRKDRLIQTRVPEDLESTLKEEAARRRLSMSHLIRSVLEDTFHLVDGVVSDLDRVVTDSVDLARNVRRNAQRLAGSGQSERPARADWDEGLDDIYGWNEVVVQRSAKCLRCGGGIERGERGYTGMSDRADRRRTWLCRQCIDLV